MNEQIEANISPAKYNYLIAMGLKPIGYEKCCHKF
jgi:hypothetical protein